MTGAVRAAAIAVLAMCCLPVALGRTVVVVDAPIGAHPTTFFNCHCNNKGCYQEAIQPGAGCSASRHSTEGVRRDIESRSLDLDIRSPHLVALACAMRLCQESGANHCRVVGPPRRSDYLAIASGFDRSTVVQQGRTASDTSTKSTTKGEGSSNSDSNSNVVGAEASGKIFGVGVGISGSRQWAETESTTKQTSTTSVDGNQSQTSLSRSTSVRLLWRSSSAKFNAETEAVQACLGQGLQDCRVQAIATSEWVGCPTQDPLRAAIEGDDARSVTVFRDAGYPIPRNALHLAVQRGRVDVIQTVAQVVDIERRDADGQTALWYTRPDRPDIFYLLRETFGHDRFAIALDSLRHPPSGRYRAERWWLSFPRTLLAREIHEGNWAGVRMFLNLGAKPLGPPESRAFAAVIEGGNRDLFEKYVKFLLDFIFDERSLKQNINLPDERGNSVMHVAAGVGNVDAGRWLIKHGASIDLRNDDGRTPLHLASAGLHVEFVRLLLEDTTETPSVLGDARDSDGLQPIHMPFFLGLVPGSANGWHGLTHTELMAGYESGTWGRLADDVRGREAGGDRGLQAFNQTVAALREHTRDVAPIAGASVGALAAGVGRYPRVIVASVLDAMVSLKLLDDVGRSMRDFALRNWRFNEVTLEDGMFGTSVRAPPYCLDLTPNICGATSLALDFLVKWHEEGTELALDDLFVSHLEKLRDEHWAGGDVPLRDAQGRWSYLMQVEVVPHGLTGGWGYIFDIHEWPYEKADRTRGHRIFSVRSTPDGAARLRSYGTDAAEEVDGSFEVTSVEDAWHTLVRKVGALRGPSVRSIPRRYVWGDACDLEVEVVDSREVWIKDRQRSLAGRACRLPLDWSSSELGVGVQTVEGREILLSVSGCDDCADP